jgi:O-acetylhomoserine (thiol)-lyase
MKIETLAVHGGYTPDPTTRAVAVPIYQTTSYAFDNTQHGADLFDLKVAGNIYTRIMNPTQDVLEKRVAAMEGGIAALAMASGMAAITAAIQTITEAGDNIVTSSTLYGGTYNLFAHTLPQYGIDVRFADYRDPGSFEKLIEGKTKAVFCESVGNPLGNITDFEKLAEIAHLLLFILKALLLRDKAPVDDVRNPPELHVDRFHIARGKARIEEYNHFVLVFDLCCHIVDGNRK